MNRVSQKHVYDEYERAQKMMNLGEYELALISARRSLESLVKQLCDAHSISYNSREHTLEVLINSLREYGIINEDEKRLMHRIRIESNKGSHVDSQAKSVSVNTAHQTVKKLKKLLSEIEKSNPESINTRKNNPFNKFNDANPFVGRPQQDYDNTALKNVGIFAAGSVIGCLLEILCFVIGFFLILGVIYLFLTV